MCICNQYIFIRNSVFCLIVYSIVLACMCCAEEICETKGWYYCNNSRCISSYSVCNGEDDCGDSSDELRGGADCGRNYYVVPCYAIVVNVHCLVTDLDQKIIVKYIFIIYMIEVTV